MSQELLAAVQDSIASGQHLITLHAVRQAEERKITPNEIQEAMLAGSAEIIEDYPNDPRGASCLVLGATARGRMLHIHASYPPTVWIITVYEPASDKWVDARTRR